MAGHHDLDTHLGNPLHHRVEVFHLEPKQHAITVGSVVAIADGAVMMFDVKTVQLQNELAVLHQLLVLRAPVRSTAAQQTLIPPAAGFYIRHTNKRLGTHGPQPNRTS